MREFICIVLFITALGRMFYSPNATSPKRSGGRTGRMPFLGGANSIAKRLLA
jgi:hypothetical protein